MRDPRPTAAIAASAALGALLLGAAPARADGVGVIVGAGAPAALAPALVVAARAALAGGPGRIEGDALAAARGAVADGAVPRATLIRFRQVREQIDEAWQAYLQVQVEFAASRLATARTAAEELLPLAGGPELYADAALRLGAVLLQLGRRAEARAALGLALALDPGRPISLREFAPDVVEELAALRAAPPPGRPVRVVVAPAGARLTIDGAEAGAAPRTVALAAGQHVIVARAAGYRGGAQAIAIDDATATVELALEIDPLAAALAAPPSTASSPAAVAAAVDGALRYGELDGVVLATAAVAGGSPALLLQRCAAGDAAARCTAVVEIGYGAPSGLAPDDAALAAAARAGWAEVASAPLVGGPTLFSDPRARGGRLAAGGCRACLSPWLWGGVGAAAVLGAVAIWAATSGARPTTIVGGAPGPFVGR